MAWGRGRSSQLGLKQKLSINFLPNAVYKLEVCVRTTLEAPHLWLSSLVMCQIAYGIADVSQPIAYRLDVVRANAAATTSYQARLRAIAVVVVVERLIANACVDDL